MVIDAAAAARVIKIMRLLRVVSYTIVFAIDSRICFNLVSTAIELGILPDSISPSEEFILIRRNILSFFSVIRECLR